MCGRSNWFSFVYSTSLTVHWKLNHIIVSSCHMFTLVDWLTWVNVGGGCYRVVSEHGSNLGLDGRCIGHAYMSVAYVSLCLSLCACCVCMVVVIVIIMMSCNS